MSFRTSRHAFAPSLAVSRMPNRNYSIITNFGCHYQCPYCITKQTGMRLPETDTLEVSRTVLQLIDDDEIDFLSFSGGGDPMHGIQHMFSETLGVYRTYDYGEFGVVKESKTWKNIVNLLADLIDRPSIKPEKVGPVYWRCPHCGKINYKSVILGDRGPLPSHNCAYCGAVIADD